MNELALNELALYTLYTYNYKHYSCMLKSMKINIKHLGCTKNVAFILKQITKDTTGHSVTAKIFPFSLSNHLSMT